MKDFFQQVKERRETAIAELDAEKFAPLIRNHLVQLFRAAHAKDSGLTGFSWVMGSGSADGVYSTIYDDGEKATRRGLDYDPRNRDKPEHPETLAFLEAVREYVDRIYNGLPYAGHITLDDLTTTRAKKAAIHGPKRARVIRRG